MITMNDPVALKLKEAKGRNSDWDLAKVKTISRKTDTAIQRRTISLQEMCKWIHRIWMSEASLWVIYYAGRWFDLKESNPILHMHEKHNGP